VSDRFLECDREGERFSVHLPAAYHRDAEWPVILLLHGSGRNHRTLYDHPDTRAALEASQSVIVMPYGGQSWWLGRYAEWPLELLDWLTPRLKLSPSASHRAVTGWSMGGFGSVRLIQRHPDRFAAWAGLIALLDFPNPSLPPEQNHSVPKVFGPPAEWAALNPIREAEALRGKKLFLLTATEAFDRTMNRNFHERLNQLGIAHEYVEVPGAHRYDVIAAHLGRLLEFLDRSIGEGQP
jgi:S-formylglutathione hydrolase FrmB